MKCNVILTDSMTTVFFNGKKTNKTFTFFAGEASYEAATKLAKGVIDDIQGGFKVSKEVFETFEQLSDKKAALRAWSNHQLVINEDGVTYNGKVLNDDLTEFLISLLEKGAQASEFEAWSKYLGNISTSGSYKVYNRLFSFLAKEDLEIDGEGRVLAWKVVRGNWKDKHSNTFDNSVGSICEVPRQSVDDDDNSHCSYGLHICSWGYLKSFSGSGDRVVRVAVNPADIISIPNDYNGEKVRCCKYEVVAFVDFWENLDSNTAPNLKGAYKSN